MLNGHLNIDSICRLQDTFGSAEVKVYLQERITVVKFSCYINLPKYRIGDNCGWLIVAPLCVLGKINTDLIPPPPHLPQGCIGHNGFPDNL